MTNRHADLPSAAVPGRAPRRVASGPPDVDPAEALLHALIAECHAIIRDDVVPASRIAQEFDRTRYYHSVVDLVGIANSSVDAITRLRGGGATPELRQRITVERVQPLIANPHADRGEGV